MFSGSMVAIVTPMTSEGNLDWPAWDRLLEFHLAEATDGIVVAGTTGESPALSEAEVERLRKSAALDQHKGNKGYKDHKEKRPKA